MPQLVHRALHGGYCTFFLLREVLADSLLKESEVYNLSKLPKLILRLSVQDTYVTVVIKQFQLQNHQFYLELIKT